MSRRDAHEQEQQQRTIVSGGRCRSLLNTGIAIYFLGVLQFFFR